MNGNTRKPQGKVQKFQLRTIHKPKTTAPSTIDGILQILAHKTMMSAFWKLALLLSRLTAIAGWRTLPPSAKNQMRGCTNKSTQTDGETSHLCGAGEGRSGVTTCSHTRTHFWCQENRNSSHSLLKPINETTSVSVGATLACGSYVNCPFLSTISPYSEKYVTMGWRTSVGLDASIHTLQLEYGGEYKCREQAGPVPGFPTL